MKEKLESLLQEVVNELEGTSEDLSEFLGTWESIDPEHALHDLPQSLTKTRDLIEFIENSLNIIFDIVLEKVENEN
jgi:hypothetical protein